MQQYTLEVVEHGHGSQTLYLIKNGKRRARISSLMNGIACSVFVPLNSIVPLNSAALSRDEAVKLADEHTTPKGKKTAA